jgi:heterotetrameric sarcosine oxidase alpha subunit
VTRPFRNPAGGSVDRRRVCQFTFDGQSLSGFEGDTLASALLANGVHLVGRSIKYRRPRGIFTAGPEEPNALCTLDPGDSQIPNVPATVAALADGIVFASQNRWPSLTFDVMSVVGVAGALFGAGFYYKTFMWPAWRWYEPAIRRLAGLGSAPRTDVSPAPHERHIDCDVLVIGGGAAGLIAARAAAACGASVVLCEQDSRFGGELQFETATIDGLASSRWLSDTERGLAAAGVEMLPGTAVVGGYDDRVLALRQPAGYPRDSDELLHIRARSRVVATGATERPIAFSGNDRPGVMLLGAVERFAARFAVRAGNDAVIFANHDRAYFAAQRLTEAGIRIAAIVDPRPRPECAVARELEQSGVRILSEQVIGEVLGSRRVSGVIVRPLDGGTPARIGCDVLGVSGGWTPALQLATQSGLAQRYDEKLGAFVPAGGSATVIPAGAAAGRLELSAALAEGAAAGAVAALTAAAVGKSAAREQRAAQGAAAGLSDPPPRVVPPRAAPVTGDPAPDLMPFWRVAGSDEKRQFVDLQNDVTVRDLRQAVAEGFREIEHVKRYTTLGVGTDQGRTAGVLGAAIVAEFLGKPLAEVGVSRARPPTRPLPLGILAGVRGALDTVRPVRRTPLEADHESEGGVMEPSGLWLRPRYYREHGESLAAAAEFEALRVRAQGGLFDASTLGKVEVAGPDAAAFLDRIYLARPSGLRIGRARYGVMLREDGMVLDDGLVLRLASHHFLLSTSTHAAAAVLSHLEYHAACSAPELAVTVTDVTDAWGVLVVAGPASRELLRKVLPLEEWRQPLEQLGHMGHHLGEWQSRPLRLLRASFSGELAYELHCAADAALALWRALRREGEPMGVIPYGLEAVDILRTEKGYLTSAEINGQVSAYDLRLDDMVKRSGPPCIGLELLARPALHESSRPVLVGLVASDPKVRFNAGAQLIAATGSTHSRGHVTSAVWSPSLGRAVGLALLAREFAAQDREVVAADPLRGQHTRVRVTPAVHFDPTGERMKR